MNFFSQFIPQYLLTKRSLTIMVTSAAAFAFLFIIIYKPFNVEHWAEVSQFVFVACVLGIVLLGMLYQSMAEINNKSAAEAAVPKIMQISEELQQWTRAFNNLPPLSEPEIQAYEDRYMPTIQRINKMIEEQADRLRRSV